MLLASILVAEVSAGNAGGRVLEAISIPKERIAWYLLGTPHTPDTAPRAFFPRCRPGRW